MKELLESRPGLFSAWKRKARKRGETMQKKINVSKTDFEETIRIILGGNAAEGMLAAFLGGEKCR